MFPVCFTLYFSLSCFFLISYSSCKQNFCPQTCTHKCNFLSSLYRWSLRDTIKWHENVSLSFKHKQQIWMTHGSPAMALKNINIYWLKHLNKQLFLDLLFLVILDRWDLWIFQSKLLSLLMPFLNSLFPRLPTYRNLFFSLTAGCKLKFKIWCYEM